MRHTQFKAVLGVDLQMALCIYSASTELALNQHQGPTVTDFSAGLKKSHKNTIV